MSSLNDWPFCFESRLGIVLMFKTELSNAERTNILKWNIKNRYLQGLLIILFALAKIILLEKLYITWYLYTLKMVLDFTLDVILGWLLWDMSLVAYVWPEYANLSLKEVIQQLLQIQNEKALSLFQLLLFAILGDVLTMLAGWGLLLCYLLFNLILIIIRGS